MPNVSNRILYEAITMLEDAGINIDLIEYCWRLADNGPPINPTNWTVVSQTPKAGTRVSARTKVVLNVVHTDEGF